MPALAWLHILFFLFDVHVCAVAPRAVLAGIKLGRGVNLIEEPELALAVGFAPHDSTP